MARNKYSLEFKKQIIADYNKGETPISIAKKYQINRSIISRLIKRFKSTNDLTVYHSGGAPRKTTQCEDRNIARIFKENPLATSKEVVRDLNLKIHDSTVRRRAIQNNLRSYITCKKPLLPKRHTNQSQDGHYGNHSRHKMTTDRQYSLLKNSMCVFNQKNSIKKLNPDGSSKYKQDYLHWTVLTKKLNKLGPPHRTIQQWKKVWCDYKRSERKRRAKSKLQGKPTMAADCDDESAAGINVSEPSLISDSEVRIKSENKDNDQNSQSIYSTYSNDYDNDYSYPDDDSLLDLCQDDSVPFIPDESSCSSYIYPAHNFNEPTPVRSFDHSATNDNKQFTTPPPLQTSNASMHNQTLYAIQNQVDHQTKLLENLTEMSGTMANLMKRQVQAVEKQTEVMRRQASATERHTAVMNRFFDMIREKMFKPNSQKSPASTDNFVNEIL